MRSGAIVPALVINTRFLHNGCDADDIEKTQYILGFPFKDLFQFASHNDRVLIICGVSINVLTGSLLPICVLFSGRFLDAAENRDRKTVDFWCALQLLSGVCCFIAGWLGTWCLERAAENQFARMKATFFHAILDQDQDYLVSFDSGELSDILMQSGAQYKDAIGLKLGTVVVCFSQFFAGFVVGLTQHWKLTLILLGMIPVLLLGGALTLWSLSIQSKRSSYSAAANILEETITNIKTIVSYNLENTFLEKYAQLLTTSCLPTNIKGKPPGKLRICCKNIKSKMSLSLVGVGMGVSMGSLFAFYALGFWAQGKMLSNDYRNGCQPNQRGCLSVGKAITVFFCVAFGSFSLGQSATPIGAIIKGRHSIRLLREIIDRKSAIPILTKDAQSVFRASSSITRSVRPRTLDGLIEFANVGYAYKKTTDNSNFDDKLQNASANIAVEQARRLDRLCSTSADTRLTARNKGVLWVFRNMNICIRPGQMVAFIGPSGCGKSTIAKLLLRFTDVVEGSLMLDGVDIRAHDIRILREQIGYVGQEPQLFDDSIYNNILHGNRLAGEADVLAAALAANAHDFIMKLPDKYSTIVGESGCRLSGGQRQRVAIARAFLRSPRILVLDEATSALDNKSEAIILHNVFQRVKKQNVTVIMIAHRLSTIRLCDSIYVFNTFANVGLTTAPCKSFLHEQGSHDFLVDLNGLYCQLLRSQNIKPERITPAEPVEKEALSKRSESGNQSNAMPSSDSSVRRAATIKFSLVDEDDVSDPVIKAKVPSLNFGSIRPTDANQSSRIRSFRAPVPSPRGRVPRRVPCVPQILKSSEDYYPPLVMEQDKQLPPPVNHDLSDGCTPQSASSSILLSDEERDLMLIEEDETGLDFVESGSHRAYYDASMTSSRSQSSVFPNRNDLAVPSTHRHLLTPTELIEGSSTCAGGQTPRSADCKDDIAPENIAIGFDHSLKEAKFGASQLFSDESMFVCGSVNGPEELNLYPDFVSSSNAKMYNYWRFYGCGSVPALILGFIGAIGSASIFPLFALCFARFIKVLSYPSAQQIDDEIFKPTQRLLWVSALCFVSHFIQLTFVEVSGTKLVRHLRFVLFDHMVHLPISFFALDRLAPGYLMTLISNDTLLVKSWANDFVFIVIQNIATLTLATIIASYAHFRLAMISLGGFAATVPATILQQRMMTRGQRTAATDSRDKSGSFTTNAMVVEVLRNPKTVSAFNLQVGLASSFDKVLVSERKRGHRQAVFTGFCFGLSQLCQFGAQSLNLWCGGRAFCDGEINDVGQMMQATFTMIIAAMGIGQASCAAIDATKGKASAKRIQSMLDVPIPIDKRDEQVLVHTHTQQDALSRSKSISHGPIKQCNIKIADLAFRYPPSYILNKESLATRPTHRRCQCCKRHQPVYSYDHEPIPLGPPVYYSIDLDIPSGQSTALVGESGCGKTTLIQLLERFYEHPGNHKILINGVCIKRWPLTQLHELMALVPQEPILFNDSIRQNIAYGNLQGDMDAIIEAAKQASAHDFIMELPEQYNTCVGPRGEKLSGGQRQKIAIARALLKNAPILLLDEATSALDPVSEVAVQETLDNIASRSDRTIITIAHRLSSIQNYDIIAVFQKLTANEAGAGQNITTDQEDNVGSIIAECGNHDTLMAHEGGIYKRLVLAGSGNANPN